MATIGMSAMAQGNMDKKEGKMDTKMSKMKMKDHVCNSSCTKDKCNYMHGEKGHGCTDACKKKM